MRVKIMNDDFILEAKQLKEKGYSFTQISELLKKKFLLKTCSTITVKRAVRKII
ncbi:MAG: hypothetical protein K8R21_00620 [Leptospira sp.]|nr:hypothetical protein [Leptospira sp.]